MTNPSWRVAALALLMPVAPLAAQRDTFRLAPERLPVRPGIHSMILAEPSIRIKNVFGATELFRPAIVPDGFAFDSARGLELAHQLAFNEAFTVEVRRRNTVTGAAIGGLLVGIPAALAGVFIGGFACFDRFECDATGEQIRLGLGLGMAGAMVGGIAGGLLGSWSWGWQAIWSWPE